MQYLRLPQERNQRQPTRGRFRTPLKIAKQVLADVRAKYAADTCPGSYVFQNNLDVLKQIPADYQPEGQAYRDWLSAMGDFLGRVLQIALEKCEKRQGWLGDLRAESMEQIASSFRFRRTGRVSSTQPARLFETMQSKLQLLQQQVAKLVTKLYKT